MWFYIYLWRSSLSYAGMQALTDLIKRRFELIILPLKLGLKLYFTKYQGMPQIGCYEPKSTQFVVVSPKSSRYEELLQIRRIGVLLRVSNSSLPVKLTLTGS